MTRDIVMIYSRLATVEARYDDVVRVRYQDTGSIDWVPTAEVTDDE